jgi:hypothetical protein
MKLKLSLIVLLISLTFRSFAQEKNNEDFQSEIRGAIMMANSHVPTANIKGSEIVIIPTWGIDVDYRFHRSWSIDLQCDIKLQSFEVEDGETSLKRTNPISLTSVIHYYTPKHVSFYSGAGIEFEKQDNLFVFKIGAEYDFEISDKFEIALNLIYESKEAVYDSWTFGILFNKRLWGKNQKY